MRRYAAAIGLITLTSCSASVDISIGGESPESAAEDLIEGELADQIGSALRAECDDVDDAEVGSSFECTGTTDDDRIVEFVTVIDEEDSIRVDTVNVIGADLVPAYEEAGAEALTSLTGRPLEATALDCGDELVVLSAESTMPCVLTDPADGARYDVVITVTDLDSGEFDIAVGDART